MHHKKPNLLSKSSLMTIFDQNLTLETTFTENCWIWSFSATARLYICIKGLRKALKLWTRSKDWSLRETGTFINKHLSTHNFWRKYLEEIRELKQNCAEAEDFDACFCIIFQRCYKFHFWGETEHLHCTKKEVFH